MHFENLQSGSWGRQGSAKCGDCERELSFRVAYYGGQTVPLKVVLSSAELADTVLVPLRTFFSNQSGSSARGMVVASVAVAAIMGVGVTAVGLTRGEAVQETASAVDVDETLTAALNAAFANRDARPAPAAEMDVAPLTDETAEETRAEPQMASAMSSAMDMAMNPVAGLDVTGSEEASINASWSAALMPAAMTMNRLDSVGSTVNALNEVLNNFQETVVSVRSGDTMMNLLTDVGIDRREAYYAIEAFSDVFDPRRIRVGQEINVAYETIEAQGDADEEGAEQFRLLNISMRTAPDSEVFVGWNDESQAYVGEARDIPLEEHFMRARGTIDSSLYVAANNVGVPDAITIGMIRIFSHSVDFLRDIRQGDSFDVYYSQHYDENGEAVMNGDVLFAQLVTRGRERNLYRYTTEDDGITDYFDEDGNSVRSFLMRTPIDGARITSSYGPRRHPVLGYNRMHKGTDFGAPTGTPIYAAGNGVVERASRYGSYGNYVRIRHANGYETAYAHMNAYGPGIRSGVRVEQGQVIGYVGATGRVTGAHLHYEVLYNGEQVNPQTIDLPSGRQLEGDMLADFQTHVAEVNQQVAAAQTLQITATASAGGGAPDIHPELSQQ